jgi:hypothetical protein
VVGRADAEAWVVATHEQVAAAEVALARAQAARLDAIQVAMGLPEPERVSAYRVAQLIGVPQMTVGRWVKAAGR